MIKEEIKKCLSVLRAGNIILYPTDTIWGLGCDATSRHAISKIERLKNRLTNKSLILLFANWQQVEHCFGNLGRLPTLAKQYNDRPTTFIFYPTQNTYPHLLAEDGSIAVRITQETFSKQLCKEFNLPLVSTSANISGQPSPQIFTDIDEKIKQGVDYIVNYNQQNKQSNKASRIIRLNDDQTTKIIRA